MGPPIPVSIIRAEMIGSFPSVDIMELEHAVIKSLNPGGPRIELILTQGDSARKNPFCLQFPDRLFCFCQKLSGLILNLVGQFETFHCQIWNMTFMTNLFDQRLPDLFLLLLGKRSAIFVSRIP